MVKIPGLDDLKKMGSDLMDSAKTVNLGGMVDKLKSKPTVETNAEGDPVKQLFHDIQTTLNLFNETQTTQAQLVKKMREQVNALAKIVDAMQQPAKSEEDKKS